MYSTPWILQLVSKALRIKDSSEVIHLASIRAGNTTKCVQLPGHGLNAQDQNDFKRLFILIVKTCAAICRRLGTRLLSVLVLPALRLQVMGGNGNTLPELYSPLQSNERLLIKYTALTL